MESEGDNEQCQASAGLSALPRPDGRLHGSRVKRVGGKIAAVRPLNHDTVAVVLQCDPGSEPLGLVAGQYVVISHSDIRKPRSYSLARCPTREPDGQYTLFIRLVPGGEFTGWLWTKDRTGERITIAGPMGKFLLDATTDTLLCFAGGSGMSAIAAILERAAQLKVQRDAYYFFSARTQADLYALDDMQWIRDHWHPNHQFAFIPCVSREPKESLWAGVRRRGLDHFRADYLEAGLVDLARSKAYFCGPPQMIDDGVKLLKASGMPDKHIYYDKFEDMSSPAPVIDNTKCVLCDECLFAKPQANCIVEVSAIQRDSEGRVTGYTRIDPANTSGLYYNTLYIDERECIRCQACIEACPAKAISPSNDRETRVLRQEAFWE